VIDVAGAEEGQEPARIVLINPEVILKAILEAAR